MFGTIAHHIAARTETVDFQIWIADGDQPLPLQVVLTYTGAAGQPSFRAQFREWNLAPDFPEGTFVFEPAPDEERIPFAVDVNAVAEMPEAQSGGAVQ